jgi:probable HAF family extracellular repeat protein
MSEHILSLTPNKGRALTLFASLLTGMVLLFGLGMRTAETQTTPAPTTPYYYEVQDLGTLQGGSNSYPLDINDSGHVVGCADTESGQQHAFLYKDGQMQDLQTLGGTTSCAYGINNLGQIVGYSETATSGETHAFIWKDDGDETTTDMEDLGTLGGTNSYAYDINNSGQVVGQAETAGGETHAFVWKDDGDETTTDMKDPSVPGGLWFGTWPWGTNSWAFGINDSGQIVGQTNTAYGDYHAFLYDIDTKKFKDLGTLGGCCSEAYGINASGQVVGWSYTSSNSYHAFLYSGEGPMQDLGDLVTSGDWGSSRAWDINDSGQVVGYSDNDYYSPTSSGSAFLYQNGEMIDLTTRLVPDDTGSVWILSWAFGINKDGQIAVTGFQGGSADRALLLTPSDTPPPSDTTPPETKITSQPPTQTNSKTASFSFTSDETGATFECSNDNQTWATCTSPYNYSSTPLQDGSHNFYVRAKDAAGNVDKTPASYSWTVDATAPVAKAPAQTFPTTSTLGTSTTGNSVPVKLTWPAATDNTGGSGIASYQLQQSLNGGAYTNVTLPSTTTTTITPSLTPSATYRFRVAAKDKAGNVSAWAYGPSFKVSAYQENSTEVTYPAGTWTRAALSGSYGGYTKYAKTSGAKAKVTFTGSSVAWVAPQSSTRGKADVYVDGAYTSTVDLYASTAQARKVVFTKSWATSGNHTLEVRVLGTTGRPQVDVDAFVVLS